jgi:hypothetical protein
VNLQADIKKGLIDQFRFKKVSGDWLQEGQCPDCGKFEAFCAADEPKIVRCGRQDRCGWEDSVRNLLPDLFEDWSKRHPITEQDPHAAADAYLQHERGLDMRYLRGAYTQELYRDQDTGQTGATIRFPIGNTHWERIIDRPGRFGKKAHFRAGGTYKGHCWVSPSSPWSSWPRQRRSSSRKASLTRGSVHGRPSGRIHHVDQQLARPVPRPAARRTGSHRSHRPPQADLRL